MHGPEYEDMKLSRARFKLALRECRRNEELMKADAMANKLLLTKYNYTLCKYHVASHFYCLVFLCLYVRVLYM